MSWTTSFGDTKSILRFGIFANIDLLLIPKRLLNDGNV